MKKLLLILLCFPLLTLGQQTYVPDNQFEYFIEDFLLGGNCNYDNYVDTDDISDIEELEINFNYFYEVYDLQGIEGFTSLEKVTMSNSNYSNDLDFGESTSITNVIFKNMTFYYDEIDLSDWDALEHIFLNNVYDIPHNFDLSSDLGRVYAIEY